MYVKKHVSAPWCHPQGVFQNKGIQVPHAKLGTAWPSLEWWMRAIHYSTSFSVLGLYFFVQEDSLKMAPRYGNV